LYLNAPGSVFCLNRRAPHLPQIRPRPSQLLQSDELLRGLAAAMPQRYRHSHWTLLYRCGQ
jgi:hypothetical protein